MKSESQGVPTAEVGCIDPELALLVRNPELVAVFDEIKRRLQDPVSLDLTDPLGSARCSEVPAQAGQGGERADLGEAAMQTYPQNNTHVDNYE